MIDFRKCICGNYVSQFDKKCRVCGLQFMTGKAFLPNGRTDPKNNTMLQINPSHIVGESDGNSQD